MLWWTTLTPATQTFPHDSSWLELGCEWATRLGRSGSTDLEKRKSLSFEHAQRALSYVFCASTAESHDMFS